MAKSEGQLVDAMARKAVTATQKANPMPGEIQTYEAIAQSGGFELIDGPTTASQDLLRMRFFEGWRTLVMTSMARWPKTITGEGFDILSSEDSIDFAVESTLAKARRAVDHGQFIARNTTAGLDVAGQRQQVDAMMRLGALEGTLDAQQKEYERAQKSGSAIETARVQRAERDRRDKGL